MDDVAAEPSAWADLRIRLAPLIGERAFAYFAQAVSGAKGDDAAAEYFHDELAASGNDPGELQVTETEALFIEWGGRAAAGTVDADLASRAQAAFSPQLASLLGEGVALGGGE